MTKTCSDLLPEQLDNLAGIIEAEKCGLVLGPYAQMEEMPDGRRISLHGMLACEIGEELQRRTGQPCPEPENLALVCKAYLDQPDTARTALEIKVRNFFARYTVPSPLLLEVAKLSFRLIFTTAPNDLLQRAFSMERKRSFREGHYQFSKTQIDDYDQTPAGWTYIYQLFGKVLQKTDNSLVLTTADQLHFVDSIQGVGKETRLPAGLRNAMQDCEAFLFIGFDYEDWYLRVLFHILKFSRTAKFVFALPEGFSKNMPPGTELFFRQQYRFSFFQNDPVDLLKELAARIESGGEVHEPGKNNRRLLFFYDQADQSLMDRLNKQLSSVKKKHGLESASIHDFAAGDELTVKNALIEEASVIVMLLSADFLANERLSGEYAQRALARQSPSVCVAAVNARQVLGAVDIVRGKAPVFPQETISLDMMHEETGFAMVAGMLEKLIAALQ